MISRLCGVRLIHRSALGSSGMAVPLGSYYQLSLVECATKELEIPPRDLAPQKEGISSLSGRGSLTDLRESLSPASSPHGALMKCLVRKLLPSPATRQFSVSVAPAWAGDTFTWHPGCCCGWQFRSRAALDWLHLPSHSAVFCECCAGAGRYSLPCLPALAVANARSPISWVESLSEGSPGCTQVFFVQGSL